MLYEEPLYYMEREKRIVSPFKPPKLKRRVLPTASPSHGAGGATAAATAAAAAAHPRTTLTVNAKPFIPSSISAAALAEPMHFTPTTIPTGNNSTSESGRPTPIAPPALGLTPEMKPAEESRSMPPPILSSKLQLPRSCSTSFSSVFSPLSTPVTPYFHSFSDAATQDRTYPVDMFLCVRKDAAHTPHGVLRWCLKQYWTNQALKVPKHLELSMNEVADASAGSPARAAMGSGLKGKNVRSKPVRQTHHKVLSVLSRITAEKYNELLAELLQLPLRQTDDAELREVVKVFFDKAVQEQHYSGMYAQLVRELCTMSEQEHQLEAELRERLLSNRMHRELMTICEEQFNKPIELTADDKVDRTTGQPYEEEDVQLKRMRLKDRVVGNIRFVGELFKNDLVTDRVIVQILELLVGAYDPQHPNAREDYIFECFLTLMDTVGDLLGRQQPAVVAHFLDVAKTIQTTHNHKRIQFLMMDLADLNKKRKWITEDKMQQELSASYSGGGAAGGMDTLGMSSSSANISSVASKRLASSTTVNLTTNNNNNVASATPKKAGAALLQPQQQQQSQQSLMKNSSSTLSMSGTYGNNSSLHKNSNSNNNNNNNNNAANPNGRMMLGSATSDINMSGISLDDADGLNTPGATTPILHVPKPRNSSSLLATNNSSNNLSSNNNNNNNNTQTAAPNKKGSSPVIPSPKSAQLRNANASAAGSASTNNSTPITAAPPPAAATPTNAAAAAASRTPPQQGLKAAGAKANSRQAATQPQPPQQQQQPTVPFSPSSLSPHHGPHNQGTPADNRPNTPLFAQSDLFSPSSSLGGASRTNFNHAAHTPLHHPNSSSSSSTLNPRSSTPDSSKVNMQAVVLTLIQSYNVAGKEEDASVLHFFNDISLRNKVIALTWWLRLVNSSTTLFAGRARVPALLSLLLTGCPSLPPESLQQAVLEWCHFDVETAMYDQCPRMFDNIAQMVLHAYVPETDALPQIAVVRGLLHAGLFNTMLRALTTEQGTDQMVTLAKGAHAACVSLAPLLRDPAAGTPTLRLLTIVRTAAFHRFRLLAYLLSASQLGEEEELAAAAASGSATPNQRRGSRCATPSTPTLRASPLGDSMTHTLHYDPLTQCFSFPKVAEDIELLLFRKIRNEARDRHYRQLHPSGSSHHHHHALPPAPTHEEFVQELITLATAALPPSLTAMCVHFMKIVSAVLSAHYAAHYGGALLSSADGDAILAAAKQHYMDQYVQQQQQQQSHGKKKKEEAAAEDGMTPAAMANAALSAALVLELMLFYSLHLREGGSLLAKSGGPVRKPARVKPLRLTFSRWCCPRTSEDAGASHASGAEPREEAAIVGEKGRVMEILKLVEGVAPATLGPAALGKDEEAKKQALLLSSLYKTYHNTIADKEVPLQVLLTYLS